MARKIEDIQLDIAEAKQLILSAKRPNNQTVLAKHLSSLKSQLEALAPPKVQQPIPDIKKQEQPQKVQVPQTQQTPKNISYTPLTKYSWDQEGSKVKIYFLLDGVGNECKANQIDINFGSDSVQMKLRDYKKSNLLFAVRKLCGPIQAKSCTYLVKTNSICLTMYKKQNKHWAQLNYKQDILKQKKQDKQPGDAMMNMMKKMYEQGDDNMKRTIAEAWTKAQDKKGGEMGSDFGMPGMGGMGGLGGMGGFGGMGGMGGKGGMGGDFGGFKFKK